MAQKSAPMSAAAPAAAVSCAVIGPSGAGGSSSGVDASIQGSSDDAGDGNCTWPADLTFCRKVGSVGVVAPPPPSFYAPSLTVSVSSGSLSTGSVSCASSECGDEPPPAASTYNAAALPRLTAHALSRLGGGASGLPQLPRPDSTTSCMSAASSVLTAAAAAAAQQDFVSFNWSCKPRRALTHAALNTLVAAMSDDPVNAHLLGGARSSARFARKEIKGYLKALPKANHFMCTPDAAAVALWQLLPDETPRNELLAGWTRCGSCWLLMMGLGLIGAAGVHSWTVHPGSFMQTPCPPPARPSPTPNAPPARPPPLINRILRVPLRLWPSLLALELKYEAAHAREAASAPGGAYYYLSFIGTAPAARGRGYASLLMRAITQRADAEGRLCLLEATSERSAALYARHGFAVTEVYRVMPAAPPVFFMRRDPQRPPSAHPGGAWGVGPLKAHAPTAATAKPLVNVVAGGGPCRHSADSEGAGAFTPSAAAPPVIEEGVEEEGERSAHGGSLRERSKPAGAGGPSVRGC